MKYLMRAKSDYLQAEKSSVVVYIDILIVVVKILQNAT